MQILCNLLSRTEKEIKMEENIGISLANLENYLAYLTLNT